MIDLSNYKEGDNLGTLYEVYVFGSSEINAKKHEGCVLTELSFGKRSISYQVIDKEGKNVCFWCGSTPYWGTKVRYLYSSLDEACEAYKTILEERINKLSRKVAEYKKTVLYGLKDAFK